MNFHLHRHRKLTEVLPVPDGLKELMADITREVLRYQPKNIESFIAEYLEAMLLTRELFQVADHTVEDVLDSCQQIMELLQKDGISQEQAEASVNVIKEEFKSHINEMGEDEPLKELNIISRMIRECGLTVEQARKATEIIESAWTHYYQRNKHHLSKISPDITHHDAVKNTLSIYQKPRSDGRETKKSAEPEFSGVKMKTSISNWRTPNFQHRERAAINIQKWYRSVKIRRQFKEMIKAAKVIQAGFKGYQNRKRIKGEKLGLEVKLNTSRPCEDGENWKNPCFEARERAAIVIQATYRTYQMRKDFEIKRNAATVIQANFRSFKARQKKTTN